MKRVERLTAIIALLQSRTFSPIEKIVEKFGVSERTIYRDIASLNKIGVPIYFEKDRGYAITDSHFVPPLSFSEEEAIALILASTLMKRFSDKKTNDHYESALDKLKYALNTSQKDTIESLEENILPPYYNSFHGKEGDFLFLIQTAIIKKQVVKIKYSDRKENVTEREIEPIGIVFYGSDWHTIAWCWIRNEYRDFIVSSIVDAKNLFEPFRKTDHLSVETYVKKLGEEWEEQKKKLGYPL